MSNYKPQYTNLGQVKLYLQNKTNFRSNNEKNGLTNQEIIKFIVNAEVRVENDLSKQYVIPFKNVDGRPFNTLPQRSQIIIQELATWKSVLLILEVNYGRSEGVRGESFIEYCYEQYNSLLERCNTTNKNGQFISTPLTGVMLNKNASYRSDADAPAPLSVEVGGCNGNIKRYTNRITDLTRSLWYAPFRRHY